MKVHFIAIGGSAMHNLALALHQKGYTVTGSDDEIFETQGCCPRKKAGTLNASPPTSTLWFLVCTHALTIPNCLKPKSLG